MKKLLLLLLICATPVMAQKKKRATAKKAAPVTVLATMDNISAQLVGNHFALFNNKGAAKDTMFYKVADLKNPPSDVKIMTFMAKDTKLYAVMWNEKKVTTTKLKTEDATIMNTEIWEPVSRTQVLANSQTTVNIKEIHFLDAGQNASETIEKVRREGNELTINKDGSVIQKNKTQQTTLEYNPQAKQYILMARKK